MDNAAAQKIVRDYVCSKCWGHLIARIENGEYVIECATDGQEHSGFVTKYYVERRRAESLGEYIEANDLLNKIGVTKSPHAGKTSKQLLDELGY